METLKQLREERFPESAISTASPVGPQPVAETCVSVLYSVYVCIVVRGRV